VGRGRRLGRWCPLDRGEIDVLCLGARRRTRRPGPGLVRATRQQHGLLEGAPRLRRPFPYVLPNVAVQLVERQTSIRSRRITAAQRLDDVVRENRPTQPFRDPAPLVDVATAQDPQVWHAPDLRVQLLE